MFLSLKDLNTLRNHQTTQKSKFEFICLQRVCKGRHQSHGWERWIRARTRWRTVETDMITGKGTFSDILTNFSSSFSNNRRISIRSLFFSSCTWKKYYLGKLRVFLKTSDFNASNGALKGVNFIYLCASWYNWRMTLTPLYQFLRAVMKKGYNLSSVDWYWDRSILGTEPVHVHLQSVWLSFNALHTQSLHYVNIRQFFTCLNCIWQIKFHFATLDIAPLHAISLKTTCIYHVFEPRYPKNHWKTSHETLCYW